MENEELIIKIGDMFDKKVDEVKRHAEILNENMRSEIKIIAEGHSFLDKKIDNIHEELLETKKELKGEIRIVKNEVDNIKVDVNNIKVDVSNIKVDVNNIKVDVNNIKKEMTIVKNYVIKVDTKLNKHAVMA